MKVGIRKLMCISLAAAGLSAAALSPASPARAADDYSSLPDLLSCPQMEAGYIGSKEDPQQVPCVEALQDSLRAVGFWWLATTGPEYKDDPTQWGVYNLNTWIVVWNFQFAHTGDGLIATGQADYATMVLLDEIANSPAAADVYNGADPDGNASLSPADPPVVPVIPIESGAQPEVSADAPDDCATSCDVEEWIY